MVRQLATFHTQTFPAPEERRPRLPRHEQEHESPTVDHYDTTQVTIRHATQPERSLPCTGQNNLKHTSKPTRWAPIL